MKSMFGITGIKVRAIEAGEDMSEVNDFLKEHDGNIIDIQNSPMLYGVTKFIIIYKKEV